MPHDGRPKLTQPQALNIAWSVLLVVVLLWLRLLPLCSMYGTYIKHSSICIVHAVAMTHPSDTLSHRHAVLVLMLRYRQVCPQMLSVELLCQLLECRTQRDTGS
jgi:hypothetical protein